MDYKEKYEQALEKARLVLQERGNEPDGASILSELFPELCESEDERIRKYLISFVELNSGFNLSPEDAKKILAWLEKQGEHAKFRDSIQAGDKVTRNEDGVLVNLSQLKRVAKPANKVEPKFKVGDKIRKKTPSSFDRDMQVARIEKDYYVCNHIGKFSSEVVPFSQEDDYELIEQKPTDKVEPKFHEGEWIIHQGTENIYQVVAVIDNQYQLKYCDNYTIQNCADVDRCARLWDITKDAKDGDVLACPNDAGDRDVVFIFKNINSDEGWVFCFCAIDANGCFCTNNDYVGNSNSTNISPATKEQRDLLFQKMKESGYMWDAEKKELKRIEQNPTNEIGNYDHKEVLQTIINEQNSAWSEEDERNLDWLMTVCERIHYKSDPQVAPDSALMLKDWLKSLKDRVGCEVNCTTTKEWSEEDSKNMKECVIAVSMSEGHTLEEKEQLEDWLKSIKDRYIPQPKQKWSNEDEKIRQDTIQLLEMANHPQRAHINGKELDFTRNINWLKSLRPQNTWKPSDEQMKCLDNVKGSDDHNGYVLNTLYNDLKKLREE